jgi:GT2 family glycosyltransferase
MAARIPPPISVVYPTCGRPELLLRSIEALLAGPAPPEEIVVVDQSRSPATRDALLARGASRIRHVPSDERGLSRARNRGVAAARFPVIGFLDDDCVPACDWTRTARAAVEQLHGSVVWIGRLVRDPLELARPDPQPAQRTVRGAADPWSVGPTGGNCLYRRSVLEELSGFDPRLGQGTDFPGAEDGDMLIRVLRAGHAVSHVGALRCHHVEWRDAAAAVRNAYGYGLGVGALLAKHVAAGDGIAMARIFARRFSTKMLAVPYYMTLGSPDDFRVNLGWSRGIVHGYRRWRSASRAA